MRTLARRRLGPSNSFVLRFVRLREESHLTEPRTHLALLFCFPARIRAIDLSHAGRWRGQVRLRPPAEDGPQAVQRVQHDEAHTAVYDHHARELRDGVFAGGRPRHSATGRHVL